MTDLVTLQTGACVCDLFKTQKEAANFHHFPPPFSPPCHLFCANLLLRCSSRIPFGNQPGANYFSSSSSSSHLAAPKLGLFPPNLVCFPPSSYFICEVFWQTVEKWFRIRHDDTIHIRRFRNFLPPHKCLCSLSHAQRGNTV